MEVTSFFTDDGPAPAGGVPVWCEAPAKESDEVWQKAVALAQSGPLLTVRMELSGQAKQIDLRTTMVEFRNPETSAAVMPPNDVTSLGQLNEATILHSLQLRALANHPYTSIGSVLVAINPLQRVDDPVGCLGTAKASEQPHPYAVAESAFSQMSFAWDSRRPSNNNNNNSASSSSSGNQSIVAGGESGAGKTESCKMVLRHLVHRTQHFTPKPTASTTSIDSRLLGSNPITEAFGNASTKRNENSSRFGKLLRLHFQQDFSQGTVGQANWGIRGASVRTYLLERSRISLHELGERNFHVFYQLLQGLAPGSERRTRLLGTPSTSSAKWRYLQPLSGPETKLSDVTSAVKDECRPAQDAKDFAELEQSLVSLDFSPAEVDAVFSIVCAVLHLGNVEFDEDEELALEGEVAHVTSQTQHHLDQCASLLGVPAGELAGALIERRIDVRGEVTTVRRTPAGASFARDAVAKAVYTALFNELIRKIDRALAGGGGEDITQLPSIGVLDIFGYEAFVNPITGQPCNGLDQLLINYTNESLQGSFNRAVFSAELDLYRAEGLIVGQLPPPPDNTSCMELLTGGGAGTKKLGVLQTIDAQAQVPQANDSAMCSALHREFAKHECFPLPHAKDRSSQFIIRHYAGQVAYTVSGFVDKNQDRVPAEVTGLFARSQLGMAAGLFPAVVDAAAAKKANSSTVISKFAASIKDLIASLEATKVSFIRCVKPNAEMRRAPGNNAWFNRKYVSMQLRCLSVPQTANVLRSGLPTRIPYALIADQYKKALPADALQIWQRRGQGSEKQFTAALFWAFDIDPSIYRLGFTKAFFGSGKLAELERVLNSSASWTAQDKLTVGKKFKLYYIRVMWRAAARKIMCQNRFQKLYAKAQRRARAVQTLQAFARMVPWRRRFLKHYAAQIQARKRAQDAQVAEQASKAREEAQRQQEEQREREIQLQVEKERQALEQELVRAKELAKMEEEARERARREEDRIRQERVLQGAEEKRLEAERLHRQALAAKILAEAALAEQKQYDLELQRGREMTNAERASALDAYEREYAMQMAKYEARRKYYGSLQDMARQELSNYQHKLELFIQSDQVQHALQQAKQYVDTFKVWARTRLGNLATAEGRQLEAQQALDQYRVASEQARVRALRARRLLQEQLEDNPWYTRALEEKDKIRKMALESSGGKQQQKHPRSSSSSSNRNLSAGGGGTVTVDRDEWAQPVQAASNQTERLRALLDSGMITPDEYASLMGTLLVQVERKHHGEDVPSSSSSFRQASNVPVLCKKCGAEANSGMGRCGQCHALLPGGGVEEKEDNDEPAYEFLAEERWSVALPAGGGSTAQLEFRARISGTETVLDPDTFMEMKLFVVECCCCEGGGGQARAVFWKVAHKFTDFIHLHQELCEAKSTYLTKEAKDALPDFPQAKLAAANSTSLAARRRSSGAALLAMFGRKKKTSEIVTGGGAGVVLGGNPQSLLKSGEAFLAQWLQGVVSAAVRFPAKPEAKSPHESMLLKFKPVDVFFHIADNAHQ